MQNDTEDDIILDAMIEALASPHRRKMIDLLHVRPWRPIEFSQELDISRSTVSMHIKTLILAGLIKELRDRTDFRARTYQLVPERFRILKDWLTKFEPKEPGPNS